MVREEDLLWRERDSGLTFMHILTASPHILCYRDVMDGPSIATLSIVPFFAETSKASLKIPHSHSACCASAEHRDCPALPEHSPSHPLLLHHHGPGSSRSSRPHRSPARPARQSMATDDVKPASSSSPYCRREDLPPPPRTRMGARPSHC